ncbi:MAG TPA: hypothetical protein VLY46_06685 [Usitatibacter sp.]|nr:hypothetical protein [Usitatibacter sp.]
METLSAVLPADPERATRIGRVKFVALVFEDEPAASGPAAAASSLQRFLRLMRRFASRVDGRPMAARP